MTDHCCPQGARLATAYIFTERDLAGAARAAALTAERRGQASATQLANIQRYRTDKAIAADHIADHEELCDARVGR